MRILYLIIVLYTSCTLTMEQDVLPLSTYAAHTIAKHLCDKLKEKYKMVTEENFERFADLADKLLAGATPEAHKLIAMQCADLYNMQPFWCTHCKGYNNAKRLEHICWSTNGNHLAYTLYGQNRFCVINRWDINTDEHTTPLNLSNLIHKISFIMFDPNNQLLVATKNGNIKIYDLERQQKITSWTAHQGNIRALSFSPDGTHMISAGDDRVIRIWNYADRAFKQPIEELHDHNSKITALKYIDGNTFVSGSFDQTARVWQRKNGSFVETKIKNIHKSITSLDVIPNGQLVAIGSQEESVSLWDLKNGSCTSFNLGPHRHAFIPTFLQWNRNNNYLAALSSNNAQILTSQDITEYIQSSVSPPSYLPKQIKSLVWNPIYNVIATHDSQRFYELSNENSLSIWEEASYISIQEVLFDRIFTHLLEQKRIGRLGKFCRNHCSQQFSDNFKHAVIARLKIYNYTELANEMQAYLNI